MMHVRYLLLATIKTGRMDHQPDLSVLTTVISDVVRRYLNLDVVTVIGHPLDDPNADGHQTNLFGATTPNDRKVNP
jgi:hypothetical protein